MITYRPLSIRTFIGAKDFDLSRQFYRDLGFQEIVIDEKMSHFRVHEQMRFYHQRYYVKAWVENSMVFLEVDDVEACAAVLLAKNLPERYPTVRFTEIKTYDWGRELFMHDPSGVLWHFGQFNA